MTDILYLPWSKEFYKPQTIALNNFVVEIGWGQFNDIITGGVQTLRCQKEGAAHQTWRDNQKQTINGRAHADRKPRGPASSTDGAPHRLPPAAMGAPGILLPRVQGPARRGLHRKKVDTVFSVPSFPAATLCVRWDYHCL